MDPFESFKKWKSLEIDPLNPKVNKKRTNKQEKKNTEKSKIISRLKYKSKYLEIELEFIDEKLEICRKEMFTEINNYCKNNENTRNPLVSSYEEKPETKQINRAQKSEALALYREIAKVAHPDKNKDNENLEDLFINATEAKELNKVNDLVNISLDLDIDISNISIDLIERLEQELNEKEKKLEEKRKDISITWFESNQEQRDSIIKQICSLGGQL